MPQNKLSLYAEFSSEGTIAKPSILFPKTAEAFLEKGKQIMEQRGKENGYDFNKERSFKKTSEAFNAITGKGITPAEVCLLLAIVKDVRQWQQPRYHQDSAEDAVNYHALKAEELVKQYNG